MSENNEPGPQLDRATKGWIAHRRRLHTKPLEPTPEQIEAARLRLERDEIARQEWLKRIANMTADEIEALENERDLD